MFKTKKNNRPSLHITHTYILRTSCHWALKNHDKLVSIKTNFQQVIDEGKERSKWICRLI